MEEDREGAALPEAFLEKMERLLGEEYGAFLESLGQERHLALKVNPRKRSLKGAGAASVVAAAFPGLETVPWAEGGFYYGASCRPGRHPYHQAGLYYIQEPSAMAPVGLLGVQPGDRVLDLCGAPGGKSAQIGAQLQGRGLLLCNEIHPARAKILAENMERMGIGNACVANEEPERLAERFGGYFDRILVDAPCSGEGMFRKNEAACQEWSQENVVLCAERQDRILDCAARMLRPGGRLVYSTCTFSPEENEGSVSRFLGRHGDFQVLSTEAEKEALGLAGCDGRPDFLEDPAPGLVQTLRLWPHRLRGEGHFAAVLAREGRFPLGQQARGALYGSLQGAEKASGVRGKNSRTRGKDSAEKDLGLLVDFVEELLGQGSLEKFAAALGVDESFYFVNSGGQVYLVSGQMPSLQGLKVLRPGLHVGELKKNRFEPSHSLAMALDPEAVSHVWNLASGERGAYAYLEGQTFPAEGEGGWYLVCVDGFGLGWGKLAGGIMKNHYPRGLRTAWGSFTP